MLWDGVPGEWLGPTWGLSGTRPTEIPSQAGRSSRDLFFNFSPVLWSDFPSSLGTPPPRPPELGGFLWGLLGEEAADAKGKAGWTVSSLSLASNFWGVDLNAKPISPMVDTGVGVGGHQLSWEWGSGQ